MPGTILVSVLEFKDPQSSSSSSSSSTPPQISIKVSMGKREYRTWGKEDFSFPLTSLRDQLMITLQDIEGNEISHTGVETRLVVEKGVWDDLFPLEGVGYVHLKFQFVLSEEEQRRIHNMRESALRRKHGELHSDNLRSPENATTVGSNAESPFWLNQEVSDSQSSLLRSEIVATPPGCVFTPADVIKSTRVGTEEGEETFPVRKETNPIETRKIHQPPVAQGLDAHLTEVPGRAIGSKEASPLAENSELVVAVRNKLMAHKLEEFGINNPEKQSPVGKTPSNVRNMISAFESSLSQDMRPHMKPPPAKSQSSKVGTEATLKSLSSVEGKTQVIKLTESKPGRIQNPFLTGESQGVTADRKNKLMHKEVKIKGEKISSEDLMREKTCKAATVSGRILLNKQHSGGNLSIKGNVKGIHPEYSEDVQNMGTSDNELKSKENWKDKIYAFRYPGTWIFPVESRHLCITTGSKEMMDLMRVCHADPEVHPGEKSSAPENVEKRSMRCGDIKANEVDKTNKKPRNPKPLNSADGETARGPVGQITRVAIMIGFATLVLFTRQRNNR